MEAKRLRALQEELTAAGNGYWAAEVGVEQSAASAWAAFARGETVPALSAMREAAESEDRQEKHIITPGRVLPARELLADMLMEAGQPAAALAEYEKSFQRDPNRFRGLYGAGRAAEAAGDQTKALDYAKRLLISPAPAIPYGRKWLGHAAWQTNTRPWPSHQPPGEGCCCCGHIDPADLRRFFAFAYRRNRGDPRCPRTSGAARPLDVDSPSAGVRK